MAGSCIVAIESRKQAARRPSPPLPNPASGSCSRQSEPVEVVSAERMLRERIEQQIRDIVCERAADEKLHREIVDALWVFAFVGAFRADPALRKDVANRAGEGFKPCPNVGCASSMTLSKTR